MRQFYLAFPKGYTVCSLLMDAPASALHGSRWRNDGIREHIHRPEAFRIEISVAVAEESADDGVPQEGEQGKACGSDAKEAETARWEVV